MAQTVRKLHLGCCCGRGPQCLTAIAASETSGYECFPTAVKPLGPKGHTGWSKKRVSERKIREHQLRRTRAALGMSGSVHQQLLGEKKDSRLRIARVHYHPALLALARPRGQGSKAKSAVLHAAVVLENIPFDPADIIVDHEKTKWVVVSPNRAIASFLSGAVAVAAKNTALESTISETVLLTQGAISKRKRKIASKAVDLLGTKLKNTTSELEESEFKVRSLEQENKDIKAAQKRDGVRMKELEEKLAAERRSPPVGLTKVGLTSAEWHDKNSSAASRFFGFGMHRSNSSHQKRAKIRAQHNTAVLAGEAEGNVRDGDYLDHLDTMSSWTDITSWVTEILFPHLEVETSLPGQRLTAFEKCLLCKMFIKTGWWMDDLASVWGIDRRRVGEHIREWLPQWRYMSDFGVRLKPTPPPGGDDETPSFFEETMPAGWKERYGKIVSASKDGKVVMIECVRRSSKNSRINHSNKVHHQGAVGITWSMGGTGLISLVTDLFGACASEPSIVELHSDWLAIFPPGSVILVDRGFAYCQVFYPNGNEQVPPAFMKGRKQLPADEVQTSRRIAEDRYTSETVFSRVVMHHLVDGIVDYNHFPYLGDAWIVAHFGAQLYEPLIAPKYWPRDNDYFDDLPEPFDFPIGFWEKLAHLEKLEADAAEKSDE